MQTAPAQRSPWRRLVRVIARVRSVNHVILSAPLSGRLWEPTRPAGEVRAGALLARVTPPGLKASLRAARTQLRLAQINVQRNRVLYHDGVVSLQILQSSRATERQMRAQAQALSGQLAEQEIHAPFAGILSYQVPTGAVVSAGTPIVTLDGRGTPWIEALVSPLSAMRLTRTQPVFIRLAGWTGSGRIHSIGHSARQSGLVALYVTPPPRAPLLPGEWVHLRFAERPIAAFVVPLAAVVMQGANALVFLDQAGRARSVPVTVLGTRGTDAWVRGALQAGAPVVVRGAGRLLDGTPLRVAP
ncbi:MAG: efflux RND transporter periplasmic adaptor subunit [Steroidobacteraceae bacterium]